MKILFITDNFPPETNAPAIRTLEHCKFFNEDGADVNIITCFPNFPDGKVFAGYKNKLYDKEIIENITVHRVLTYITRNAGFVKRLLDFISFAIASFIAGLFIKSDVVVSTSPQFFTCFAGFALSRIKRVPWVLEIRDLWPESVFILDKKSTVYKLFYWFEYFFYRHANRIIVVTNSFKKTMVSNGIDGEKINVIFNGADFSNSIPPSGEIISGIRKKLDLQGKFVLGYIGTFGIAQNIPFYVNLAKKIEQISPDIILLLIGAGVETELIQNTMDKVQPKNVILLPKITKEEVPLYLGIIDVSLIPLRNEESFKKVIPSKIFENAGFKKPVLLGVEGEVKEILETYQLGIFFLPENEEDFLAKLRLYYENKVILKPDYENFYKKFDRKLLAAKMLEVIRSTLA